jgi:hypothetical protein
MKRKESERLEAIENLKRYVKPGDTVYTSLRHVSSSGMFRAIDVFVIQDNQPLRITWNVGKACDIPYRDKHNALGVSGCGMDMGFHVVYNLSRVMFRDGFDCVGNGCPSNDHSNGENNAHHKDGGYALKQRWL